MTWDLAFYRFVQFLIWVVAKLAFRIEIQGAERIPTDRPFVLAPVHRSNLDFAIVAIITRRRMRYMGKDTIWKYSIPGHLITALGAFPVRRGTADREALRQCVDIVNRGEPLVIFPEGTRQSGPEVQTLFEGAAYIASKTNAPIVPVGIGGSEAAMPKGAKMIRPTKVVVVVGEPIEAPRSADGGRLPRRAVHDTTEELARVLQDLFDQARTRSDARS